MLPEAFSRPIKNPLASQRYFQTAIRRIDPDGEDAVEQSEFDANGNRTASTDPNGNITTWTWTPTNDIETVTDPDGRVSSSDYDLRQRQISQTDPGGATESFDYDERGRLIRQSGPETGQFTEFTRDGQGNETTRLVANGRLIASSYDIRDRLLGRTDQFGAIESFTYDAAGNVERETDGEGRQTVHVYDGRNRRTQSTLPENRVVSMAYNAHDEVTSETDANGNTTSHGYDALGRRIQTTLPDGSTRSMAYDANGNPIAATNARGFTTTFDYDGLDRVTRQSDPSEAGTIQSWTYDVANNVLTHSDRRGIETRTTYDRENRPLEQRRAGVIQAINQYDPAGNVVSVTDANGNQTTTAYDLAGRRTTETRPNGVITRRTWTVTNDLETVTDPDGRITTSDYDLRQRQISQTDHAGQTTTFSYDRVGNQTGRTNPGGGSWTFEYDGADRLATVTDSLDHQTTYTWDGNNNRLRQTDANGHTTSFTYDVLDNQVSRTWPDGTVETFVHDPHGNRTEHIDGNGQVRTFTYDALDRLSEARYPAAQGDEAEVVAYQYDGNGNRTEVTETAADGSVRTTTFAYDNFERLASETDRYGQTTTHAYDANGNRTRRTDPTGTTRYGFDALNRLISLTAPGRGAVNYRYTQAGLVTRIDHPDGTRTEQTHDPVGRIETISHFAAGQRQAFYAYTYDANGNRTSQIEDLGTGEVETTYAYDAADRLVSSERAGRATSYVLDPVGNRIEEAVTENAITTVKTFDYNTRDQLQQTFVDGALEATFTFDANGNRIEANKGGTIRQFNFTARDRLKSLNLQGAPPEVEWQYDDAGFRVAETTPSEARRFRWDGERLSFETNILGNLLARYDHGPDRLLAETEAGSTRIWLTDALQTPVKRLNPDGSVYSTTRYDEFGLVEEESSPDTPRFGFTGHQRGPEQEPDLYYAQQRWYNAATGRFLSEDPLLGNPNNPPSLHRYLYAFANPTVFVDPDGRIGFLTSLRDRFNRTDEILREKGENSGTLGLVGFSALRALTQAGSAPVRGLNLASDGIAAVLPGETFEGVRQTGREEFGKTAAVVEQIARNPGATAANIRDAAVATTTGVLEGDRGAASDAISFFGQALSGAALARNFARTAASKGPRTDVVGEAPGAPATNRLVQLRQAEVRIETRQRVEANVARSRAGRESSNLGGGFSFDSLPISSKNARRLIVQRELTRGQGLVDARARAAEVIGGRFIDSNGLLQRNLGSFKGQITARRGRAGERFEGFGDISGRLPSFLFLARHGLAGSTSSLQRQIRLALPTEGRFRNSAFRAFEAELGGDQFLLEGAIRGQIGGIFGSRFQAGGDFQTVTPGGRFNGDVLFQERR